MRLRLLARTSFFEWTTLAILVSTAGCQDDVAQVYTARAYSPAAGCLQDYRPIGLVTSRNLFTATCSPVCLTVVDQLFVSSVCQPYPDEAVLVDPASSADCQTALADLSAGLLCSQLPAGDGGAGGDADDAGNGGDDAGD